MPSPVRALPSLPPGHGADTGSRCPHVPRASRAHVMRRTSSADAGSRSGSSLRCTTLIRWHVTGRQGLRLSVDRARAAVSPGERELRVPDAPTPPASALDSALVQLTRWYGTDAADLISLGMEYPRPTASRRSSTSAPRRTRG